MHNLSWIESPANSQREISPAETALKESFIAAQKIAFSLLCASNQLCRVDSPDVTDCAALVRVAIHKPEKERANAVKAAQLTVLQRQVDYISTRAYYLQHAEAWQAIRPILVAQLEAVAIPETDPKRHFNPQHVDTDICLNCQAVIELIEGCDISVNEANKRHYSRPTQKHAETAFQKAFDALITEVTGRNWLMDARLAVHAHHDVEILRDAPVDKVSSTDVPAEFVKCAALFAAREAFERVFTYDATTSCRDFNESTRGTFNDTQLSESLLAAMPDVAAMQRIEERRDEKLRQFGRAWRGMRNLVDNIQALYVKVAELLPEALAEAGAIEDANMRRRAQNLCLFAARRLKENLKYVRNCDRNVGDRNHTYGEISDALGRAHQALVERIKNKEIHRPSNRCREEPYMG